MVSRIEDDAARRINERSRSPQGETYDRKLRCKRFENHHSAGVVEARENESGMASIGICHFVVGQMGKPVYMSSDAAILSNSLEPRSIVPVADNRQTRLGKPPEYFGHCANDEMEAFPVKKAPDKKEGDAVGRLRYRLWRRRRADGGKHDAPGLKTGRDMPQSFMGCAGYQCGFRKRSTHQRVESCGVDQSIPQRLSHSIDESHAPAERAWRSFSTADRAEDERNPEISHKGRLAESNKCYMVNYVEMVSTMKAASVPVSSELPEKVVEVQPAGPMLKVPEPYGKVKIDDVDGKIMTGKLRLYCWPVVFTRDYSDLVAQLCNREQPVPAYGRLGALAWLTCVCGQKNFHTRQIHTSASIHNYCITRFKTSLASLEIA